jgi:malic enzyme
VVLQWEDFKQHNALRLLDRYRQRITSFNDDIQGTAAVVLSGILTALRSRRESLSQQRIVLVGTGGAGVGIARLLTSYLREPGHPSSIVMLDSRGLIFEGRADVAPDKLPYAMRHDELTRLDFPPADRYDLATVVDRVSPTILIGTTGTPDTFTERAIRAMAARVPVPIVLPLSNPTAKCEATPADVLAWTGGRALVATGSPFDPVVVGGRTHLVAQANNVFIFPGVGLGAIVSGAREITDQMFLVAAATLADLTAADRLDRGALYPPLAELRGVSRAIAIAVATEAYRSGLARRGDGTHVVDAVDAAIWTPRYGSYEAGDLPCDQSSHPS